MPPTPWQTEIVAPGIRAEAVHDQHDRTLLLIVEPAVEGMVEPLVGRPPLGLRQSLLGLQPIIDDEATGCF